MRQNQRAERDPFIEMTNNEFVKMFRLSKQICTRIISEIEPHLKAIVDPIKLLLGKTFLFQCHSRQCQDALERSRKQYAAWLTAIYGFPTLTKLLERPQRSILILLKISQQF